VTLLAADTFASNGHLVEACAQLGYLVSDAVTLDPTFGKGNWWTRWRPTTLITSDLKTGVDFRNLPLGDNSIEQAVFDPPYVCKGGRATSGMPEFDDAYGIDTCPSTPLALQQLIADGMEEVDRVVEPRSIVLVKCQDYISSGRLWAGTLHTPFYAVEALGWTIEDRVEHLAKHPRPQPGGRRQVHFRRNLSTLFVFRTGGLR